MASNGSTSVAVTAYDTLKFNWTQYGQSTINNLTLINWSLQLISGSAGRIESTVPKAWSVTVNGTTYSGTNSVAIGNNTTKTLASGQTSIPHNSDGTKVFIYSFSQTFDITFAGVSVGTKTGSGSGALNTIPRATTPVLNVTNADMGSTITIYTTRASEAFTHNLSYSFAGGPYTTIASGIETSMYWAIPLELASSVPNTTAGTLTIRCITMNGDTVVGTKTALLTAKVPTTVIPSVRSVTHAEANSGAVAGIGAYVQTKSRASVIITAEGTYGSTIKSYVTTFEGKTYTGATFITDTIGGSGELNLVTTVTDSRGRTATETTRISVMSYTPPQITTFHVARYNEGGEADPDGEKAWVKVAYSVTALNDLNIPTAKIEYRQSGENAWVELYNRNEISIDTTLKPEEVTFPTDYQYDFRITLTDIFNESATYHTVIPSGAVIFDIKADGKGIAFFKTSTKPGVDIEGALPGTPIALTSNADLDDLTDPGVYAIPTTTISETILNKPYDDDLTANIEVKRTGEDKVTQMLHTASKTNGMIYERAYDSTGWGLWHVVYAGAGKILWSGSSLLTADQTVMFSEPLNQQANGMVLVFSRYISSAAVDYFYSCHYIPRLLVNASALAGQTAAGVTVIMATNRFEAITGKYLRITNSGITGDDANAETGTANGVTYNNDRFALRYVIGV